jgi:DNA-directed RNA polymerase subunit M/transcription elongation factor TFIIS
MSEPEPKKEIDCEYTGNPVCPYCGHVDQEWWENSDAAKADDEESWLFDCPACDEEYRAKKYVTIRFDTEKKGD